MEIVVLIAVACLDQFNLVCYALTDPIMFKIISTSTACRVSSNNAINISHDISDSVLVNL